MKHRIKTLLHTYDRGFTLIELLVVLALISIVLIIAINGIKYGITFSNDSVAKQDATQLDQVLSSYYSSHNDYPLVTCQGSFDGSAPLGGNLIPVGDAAYQQYSNFLSSPGVASLISKGQIGYCSSPSDGNGGAGAYIIIVQTSTTQSCTDTAGHNYYIIGKGSYLLNGTLRNFNNIPTDMSMTLVANATGYGINCFKI